jgi:3'(2'), 5'-bisphosphate nucleotidase
MGGSLKVIEIAKGSATVYICPTMSHMHLWDLCAPSVIVEEAGGKTTDLKGEPFRYDARETRNDRGVLVTNGVLHNEIVERIRRKEDKKYS